MQRTTRDSEPREVFPAVSASISNADITRTLDNARLSFFAPAREQRLTDLTLHPDSDGINPPARWIERHATQNDTCPICDDFEADHASDFFR